MILECSRMSFYSMTFCSSKKKEFLTPAYCVVQFFEVKSIMFVSPFFYLDFISRSTAILYRLYYSHIKLSAEALLINP